MSAKWNIGIQVSNLILLVLVLYFGYQVTAADVGGKLLNSVDVYKIDPIDGTRQKSYCVYCKGWASKTWEHCIDCGKCVPQFDHHCQWLNNCVAGKRYIEFYFLLWSYFLHSSITLILSISSFFLVR